MVVMNQLRISDDGQKMCINAHINSASEYDNTYFSKITICTENQVYESNPQGYDGYVYQQTYFTPISKEMVKPVFNETQYLSEKEFLKEAGVNGGWKAIFAPIEPSEENYISFIFSTKNPMLSRTGYKPVLVAATGNYNPEESFPNSKDPEILFVVEGAPSMEKSRDAMNVWQFSCKKQSIGNLTSVRFYLYQQIEEGVYSYLPLNADATPFPHYYHFLWQFYYKKVEQITKEYNAVIPVENFNFNKADLSHNMFFVFAECTTVEDNKEPIVEESLIGVTYDYSLFFNEAMKYTKVLTHSCHISDSFIDFILNVEALKISIETGHYVPAKVYFKNLLEYKNKGKCGPIKDIKSCGCYG